MRVGFLTDVKKNGRGHLTLPAVKRPKGRQVWVIRVAYTSVASVENKWLELEFTFLHVNLVAVTETWPQPVEVDSELVTTVLILHDGYWEWTIGVTLILVPEKYGTHKGHQLKTPNIQVPEVIIANGGSRNSVVDEYRSSGSTLAEDLELFNFLCGCREWENSSLLRDFNASEICWAYETSPEGIPVHLPLEFVHNKNGSACCSRNSMEDRPIIISPQLGDKREHRTTWWALRWRNQ